MFRRRPTGKAVSSLEETVEERRDDEGCTCASADRTEQRADAQSWFGLDSGGAFALGSFCGISDKDRKARAERLAIFVGLWPPTFVLLGKVLQDIEATPEEQVARALEPEKEKVKA
jgi:hypothetical protein